MEKKRVRAQFSIRSDIYERLRDFTYNKHSKLHGAVAYEVENAICEYLDKYENLPAHAHSTHKPPSTTKKTKESIDMTQSTDNDYLYGEQMSKNNGKNKSPFYKTMSGIFDTMINGYGMTEDSTIHSEAVKKIIKNVAGGDERTIKKYFKESSKYLTDNGEFEFTLNFEKLQADDII